MQDPLNVIEELAGAGSLERQGTFDLDAAKAREKLQSYQLEDPHHYVLEFVQVAHLLGASHIEFEIDADEMEASFDGETFGPDALSELYQGAFLRAVDPMTTARRALAIGVNASMAMDPKLVVVESGGRSSGTRVTIRPGHPEEDVVELDVPLDHHGTRIYLRERPRLSHLREFFQNLRGDLAEKTALRERCAHASIPIILDGQALPRVGLNIPRHIGAQTSALITRHFETERARGVVGFVPETVFAPSAQIVFVQNGVLIEQSHHITDALSWRAVVDLPRARKDLSQAAFIRDADFDVVMNTTIPDTLHMSVKGHLDAQTPWDPRSLYMETKGELGAWLRGLTRELMAHVVSKRALGEPIPMGTLHLVNRLETHRTWTLADAPTPDGSRLVSLRELREGMASKAPLYTSQTTHRAARTPGTSGVLLVDSKQGDEDAKLLTRYLRVHQEDRTTDLQRMNLRAERERAWAKLPVMEPRSIGLAGGEWFAVPGGRGRWAFEQSRAHAKATMSIVHRHKLLVRRALPPERAPSFEGVTLEFWGDFEINAGFDGIAEAQLEGLVGMALRTLPEALEAWARAHAEHMSESARDWITRLLRHRFKETLVVELADLMNITLLDSFFEQLRDHDALPFWSRDLSTPPYGETPREALARLAPLGGLLEVPIVPVISDGVGSAFASMREILDRDAPRIEVYSPGQWTIDVVLNGGGREGLVRATRAWRELQRELQSAAFSEGHGLPIPDQTAMWFTSPSTLHDVTRDIAEASVRRRVLGRPKAPEHVAAPEPFKQTYAHGTIEVRAGMLAFEEDPSTFDIRRARGEVHALLCAEGRQIDEVHRVLPVGRFSAIVTRSPAIYHEDAARGGPLLSEEIEAELVDTAEELLRWLLARRITHLDERDDELTVLEHMEALTYAHAWCTMHERGTWSPSWARDERLARAPHLPLLRALDGSWGRRRDMMLTAAIGGANVLYVVHEPERHEAWGRVLPTSRSRIFLLPDFVHIEQVVQDIMGPDIRLVNALDDSLVAETRSSEYQEFLTRPRHPLTIEGAQQTRPLNHGTLTGVLGLVSLETKRPNMTLTLCFEDRALDEFVMLVPAGEFRGIVQGTAVRPRDDFSAAVEDGPMMEAMRRVARDAEEMLLEPLKRLATTSGRALRNDALERVLTLSEAGYGDTDLLMGAPVLTSGSNMLRGYSIAHIRGMIAADGDRPWAFVEPDYVPIGIPRDAAARTVYAAPEQRDALAVLLEKTFVTLDELLATPVEEAAAPAPPAEPTDVEARERVDPLTLMVRQQLEGALAQAKLVATEQDLELEVPDEHPARAYALARGGEDPIALAFLSASVLAASPLMSARAMMGLVREVGQR